MWRNYLTIAVRSLSKNRLFAALNMVGLAVGMAACLLIALWVRHETTFDRWLPEAERVFAVQGKTQYPGKDAEVWAGSSAVMLPLLAQDFPQIESFTRLMQVERAVRLGARLENQRVALVDPGFFDVLRFPLVEGSTATVLKRHEQIAISEGFARAWFGDASAVGQTLTFTVKGEKRPFEVAAVVRTLPSNSMFEFDVAMVLLEDDLPNPDAVRDWGNFTCHSLVKLRVAADAGVIDAGAAAFMQKYKPSFLKVEEGFFYQPQLKNLVELHLQSPPVGYDSRPPGDPRLVLAIAATGLLILIIATITYVNLATARVSLRAREVGLRKTLGAERGQLMAQFLLESTLLASLSGLLALALVELALPAFNRLLAQRLSLHYLGTSGALLPLVAMVLLVGLGGGWYPALVLTRLRPREALAGAQGGASGGRVRQLLVVGQFGIAVLLMTSMAIIYAQVARLREVDMGYQPVGLIVIPQLQRAEVKAQQKQLLDAMLRVPGVKSATRSVFQPTSNGVARQPAYVPGVPEAQAPQISAHPVDWNYLETYGAQLIAGRDLNERFGNDDWPDIPFEAYAARGGGNALINREALSLFGLTEPREALGKTFDLRPSEDARITVTVVGVVENIRLRSARAEVLPSFYAHDANDFTTLTVRFQGVPPAEMTSRLDAAWRQLFPDTPFSSRLVDEAIAGYYEAEARRGNLFALFAAIAIVLCAVGLYGLAVFTAEVRTREIGIRKVLGASVSDVVRLLVWQFSKPVLLATVLAWPVAWLLMRDWLDGFAVRITLTPLPFLASGLLALSIALATVTWHAIQAARASPMDALRHE